jgi:hypothetical protein
MTESNIVSLDVADGDGLLNDVHSFLERFIQYPCEHSRIAHTLWIAHTHLMDVWAETPRLAFLSPEPASGKTRALEITELLVPRPVLSVNASPAYLFRKVSDHAGLPTILFDEIDTIFGPKARDNEDLRGLLNAGHRRGATSGRCIARGAAVDTVEFPAYCAVAMAGLGSLPDTILTRSVIIRMRKKGPNEVVEPYRRRLHAQQGEELCRRLATWAAGTSERVVEIVDAFPDLPVEIVDRDADVWEPLISVADAVGGDWPNLVRVSAVTLVTQFREHREASLGVRLLVDLKEVFREEDHFSTAHILTALYNLPESPWGDIRGKPLASRQLAQLLKQYDVRPKVIREPEGTMRGYERFDLLDPWERYLPKESTEKSNVTELEFR